MSAESWSTMISTHRNLIAYLLLMPALSVMVLAGIIPLGFVVYYSVHDTFAGNNFVWVGWNWYAQVLASHEFHSTLARSLTFSALALILEVPLGLFIALRLPPTGWLTTVCLVFMTIPLLTPSIVVGYLWAALVLPDAGPLYEGAKLFGLVLNLNRAAPAWLVIVLMDLWHWTGLVVLLSFAGLRTIPEDSYRAARIDGASPWAVVRYVQLPRLRTVLLVAVFLRFMDSFIVYTEPYVVTHGGPGLSTIFLSHDLVLKALVEFNLGEAGAMAIVYLMIVLCVSWVFFMLISPQTRSRGD